MIKRKLGETDKSGKNRKNMKKYVFMKKGTTQWGNIHVRRGNYIGTCNVLIIVKPIINLDGN